MSIPLSCDVSGLFDCLYFFLYFSGILGSIEQLTIFFRFVSSMAFVAISNSGITNISMCVSQFSKSSYPTPKCFNNCIRRPNGFVEKFTEKEGEDSKNGRIDNTLSTMAFPMSINAIASDCASCLLAIISSLIQLF